MPTSEKSIIVLAGLPLSGKSTVGEKLSATLDIPLFDIDQTRQEIAPGGEWLGPKKEKEIMLASYKRNHKKASKALGHHKIVILSATYSRESYHGMIRLLADEHEASLYFFLLQAPDEVVLPRLEKRLAEGSLSNITSAKAYREVKDRYTPFQGKELTAINTDQSIDETFATIIAKLPTR